MLPEKKALSLEEIEAQAVLELPDRELMLTFSQSTGDTTQTVSGSLIGANVAVGNIGVAVCGVNVLSSAPASC